MNTPSELHIDATADLTCHKSPKALANGLKADATITHEAGRSPGTRGQSCFSKFIAATGGSRHRKQLGERR